MITAPAPFVDLLHTNVMRLSRDLAAVAVTFEKHRQDLEVVRLYVNDGDPEWGWLGDSDSAIVRCGDFGGPDAIHLERQSDGMLRLVAEPDNLVLTVEQVIHLRNVLNSYIEDRVADDLGAQA